MPNLVTKFQISEECNQGHHLSCEINHRLDDCDCMCHCRDGCKRGVAGNKTHDYTDHNYIKPGTR